MKPDATVRRLLLRPLVPLYRLALKVRETWFNAGLAPVRRLTYPVISIGNLSTGGSGKTPLTIALAKALIARGLRPDVLSRGYGREAVEPAHVLPDGTTEEFGDEPVLVARETGIGVYVAPERFDAGVLAEADAEKDRPPVAPKPGGPIAGPDESKGAPTSSASPTHPAPAADPSAEEGEEDVPAEPAFYPIHLLDDGFQHRQLFRNADILLIDHHDWHDILLPAGNLREPREAAHRATVIAIPAEEPEFEEELRKWGWQGPIWRLHRRMEIPFVDGPVLAFCGIARPEQFFQALKAEGLHMVAQLSFPDHYNYPNAVLEHSLADARKAGAKALITTEKDLARMGKLASIFPDSMPLLTAKLSIEIEDVEAALDWLLDGLF